MHYPTHTFTQQPCSFGLRLLGRIHNFPINPIFLLCTSAPNSVKKKKKEQKKKLSPSHPVDITLYRAHSLLLPDGF